MLDVIDIADWISSGQLALTDIELNQMGKTLAQFNSLTLDQKKLLTGPIALARYKSKKTNANPHRIYTEQVITSYGLTADQLNKLGWTDNQKQYVLSLSSSIPAPISVAQIGQLQADYEKPLIDLSKKLVSRIDFTQSYPLEKAIGQLGILQFD